MHGKSSAPAPTVMQVAAPVSTPAPAAVATPIPETPSAAAVSLDALQAQVIALFAQHTGYEVTDLVPSYQLEADLGIDTVKQAEIFSILREKFALPKDPAFRLSDVQTIEKVVQYVQRSVGAAAPTVAAASPAAKPVSVPTSTLPRILLFGGDSREPRSLTAEPVSPPAPSPRRPRPTPTPRAPRCA